MIAYLTSHGVQFEYNVQVLDVKVDVTTKDKVAKTIELKRNGNKETIQLTPDDLVFITNGSITESSTYGDNHTPAPPTKDIGGSWNLWRNLANKALSLAIPKIL